MSTKTVPAFSIASPKMPAFTFRHRVAVDSPVGFRLFHTNAATAQELINAGASIYAMKDRNVAVIRITAQQELDLIKLASAEELWPGSYGIERVHFAEGRYYQHRSTREDEMDEAA